MISAKIESVQSYMTAAHAFVTNVEIRIAGSTGPAWITFSLSFLLPFHFYLPQITLSEAIRYATFFFTTYLPGFEPLDITN